MLRSAPESLVKKLSNPGSLPDPVTTVEPVRQAKPLPVPRKLIPNGVPAIPEPTVQPPVHETPVPPPPARPVPAPPTQVQIKFTQWLWGIMPIVELYKHDK